MLHLGGADGRLDEHVVDRAMTLVESTSPSALLSGSLDAARRFAAAQRRARCSTETVGALRGRARRRSARIPGLDVLDERLVERPGVHAYDPLRLVVDVRGTGASGYRAGAADARARHPPELAGENVIVAVFGMGETDDRQRRPPGRGARAGGERLPGERDAERRDACRRRPWGPLEMTPREAFLGAQEVVPIDDAVGRIAAESLAAYPPGIPNVLPGERLTAETWDYIQAILAHGGSLRGASDRTLRTRASVAVEAADGRLATARRTPLSRLATRACARSRAARTSPIRPGSTSRSSASRSTPRPAAGRARASARRRSAPRRSALRPYHPPLDVDVFGTLSVVDWGDLDITPGNAERTAGQIAAGLGPLARAGVVPVVLGGDHSVVLGELRAHAAVHGPVALVLLDAHADTWDHYYGERYFHGTPFRRALEEGLLLPERSLLAGMRGSLYSRSDLVRGARAGVRDRARRRAAGDGGGRVRPPRARSASATRPRTSASTSTWSTPRSPPAPARRRSPGSTPREALAPDPGAGRHAVRRLRRGRGVAAL